MKSVTVKQIMSFYPCENYTEERIENLRKKVCGRRKRITKQDIINAPIPIQDRLWVLLRKEFFTDMQLHQIAIWCWEKIAKPIWEKYLPEDKSPHEMIQMKKMWLKGKVTDEQLSNARFAWLQNAMRTPAYASVIEAASSTAYSASMIEAQDAAQTAAQDAASGDALNKILKHINKLGE